MDEGRSGPPDPGGQASQRGEESSKTHDRLTAIVQKPNQTHGLVKGTVQKPNQTHGLVKGTVQKPNQIHGLLKGTVQKPNQTTGSPPRGIVQKPNQPPPASAFNVGDMGAALPHTPHGTAKEMVAMMRQRQRVKGAAARAASTSIASSSEKRAALESAHDDVDEGRASKRPQTPAPAGVSPFKAIKPIPASRSMVWVDFGVVGKPLFGSPNRIPGVTVKLAVSAGRMGDPSVVLSMSVNKGDLSKPVSDVEAAVSRFELVWEAYAKTEDGFGLHSFDYAYLADNLGALKAVPEARVEIMKLTQGNLEQIGYIDMKVRGCRVSAPYEPQYWNRLRGSSVVAHRALGLSADCLNSLAQSESSQMHFKFWFRLSCKFSEWERTCAGLFKQCVDGRHPYVRQYDMEEPLFMDSGRRDPRNPRGQTSQSGGTSPSNQNAPHFALGNDQNALSASASASRGSGPAPAEGQKFPRLTSGKSQNPTETVGDDRLAVPGSSSASSPGYSGASPLSVEQQLEDQIVELQYRALNDRRRIRDLEGEVGALKAEAMASATQQPQAIVLKQRDEQISELQAKHNENERLIKDLLLERKEYLGQLKELVRSTSRKFRQLPGMSEESDAGDSSDDFPAASDEFPAAIPNLTIGDRDEALAARSDQGIEIEPLDEAEGFHNRLDPQDDEASDAAIGTSALAEPPTPSPPGMPVEDHEHFNADWAAECHNLKKMQKSSKSKRRQQQKQLTVRD